MDRLLPHSQFVPCRVAASGNHAERVLRHASSCVNRDVSDASTQSGAEWSLLVPSSPTKPMRGLVPETTAEFRSGLTGPRCASAPPWLPAGAGTADQG